MTYISEYDSILGKITLASDKEALTGLWLEGQKYYQSTVNSDCVKKALPIFDQTKKWLDIYFDKKDPDFIPLLYMQGTLFRKRVWDELLKIPYGQTRTYLDIAKRLNIRSARSVGQAIAHNPISIIVPCHRVIGANQKITGYAGGVDKKIALLEIEGYDVSMLK